MNPEISEGEGGREFRIKREHIKIIIFFLEEIIDNVIKEGCTRIPSSILPPPPLLRESASKNHGKIIPMIILCSCIRLELFPFNFVKLE